MHLHQLTTKSKSNPVMPTVKKNKKFFGVRYDYFANVTINNKLLCIPFFSADYYAMNFNVIMVSDQAH